MTFIYSSPPPTPPGIIRHLRATYRLKFSKKYTHHFPTTEIKKYLERVNWGRGVGGGGGHGCGTAVQSGFPPVREFKGQKGGGRGLTTIFIKQLFVVRLGMNVTRPPSPWPPLPPFCLGNRTETLQLSTEFLPQWSSPPPPALP